MRDFAWRGAKDAARASDPVVPVGFAGWPARACDSFVRRPMAPTVVQSRVDWVTLAYRVELDGSFLAALEHRAEIARKHGRAAIAWGPVVGQLSYSRSEKTYQIRNADYSMRIDVWAPGRTEGKDGPEPGWTIEIVWSGQGMADRDLDVVVRATRKLAASCGAGGKVWESRLRRLDLCADVAGWWIDEAQAGRIVRRPRARMTTHPRAHAANDGDGAGDVVPGVPDVLLPVAVHTRREIEGLTVGAGGDVTLRIYDKPEELKKKGEEVTAAEHARWTRGGWDGLAPATRVEYQLRGDAMKELGIRDVDRPYDPATGQIFRTIGEVVGRVWLWALDWARLALDDDERGSRRTTDPVWTLLRAVAWGEGRAVDAHGRVRVRGGATHEQLLGCALSVLGARGKLAAKSEAIAWEADPADNAIAFHGDVQRLFAAAGDEVATHLAAKWKTARAAHEHVAIVSNATRARFEVFPRALMQAFGELRQLAKAAPRAAAPVAVAAGA